MSEFSGDAAGAVLLGGDDYRAGLLADAWLGLTATPKSLPPKYFYDDRGSELFDQITLLAEYYLTRAERALLATHAVDIAKAAHAEVLLELGSGSSEKTGALLDALDGAGRLTGYVPVDVSAAALGGAVAELARTRPELAVYPVVADFERHLDQLPAPGRRMAAFLGSTIGNFEPARRSTFLANLAGALQPGETVLIGLDLVKDPDLLVAAYDDAAGVTAEFNRNVLHVLNRELGADFDPSAFTHVALWDADNEWMDMRLRADAPMRVRLPALGLTLDFAREEEIHTEISAKFRREPFESELVAAGFAPSGWWASDDFALILAERPADSS